jgi:hypothetical protein
MRVTPLRLCDNRGPASQTRCATAKRNLTCTHHSKIAAHLQAARPGRQALVRGARGALRLARGREAARELVGVEERLAQARQYAPHAQ